MSFTGLREQTPYRMILDAGACWVGINEAELRATGVASALSTQWVWNGTLVTPRPLGATRGGSTFDPQKEERQVEVDNARVPLMGMNRVDRYEPMLSVTLLELSDVDTLKYAFGQADVTRSASGFDEIQPRINVLDTDYLPNVAVLARVSENNQAKPAIVIIRNAKVIENASLPFEDPGEVATEVSFKGHAFVTDPFNVPCAVYLPVPEDGLGGSGS